MPRATILVVEDDAAMLSGLLDVLVFNGFETEGAEDGAKGLELALSGRFDLVLLDVMLPEMDGFSVLRALREKRPMQPVLMLTAKGSEDDVLEGFNAGADDYICKPFSLRELMARVEAVLRRSGKPPEMAALTYMGLRFNPTTLEACHEGADEEEEGECISLTRRELDIVAYLCAQRDRIVSKKELLTRVWHYADADIETRTVDIHIQKLRKKLSQLIGERQMILTVRGEGYRLASEEGEECMTPQGEDD